MKKYISMILAVTMVMALFAGCAKGGDDCTKPSDSTVPGSALEVLETVWGKYAEDEKFPAIGGGMGAPVDNAPGSYDLADENISYSLLIPAGQLANVTEAASMIHMMNSNTFTAAAYKLADGVKAEDFANAMKDAVMNNQWICGFPEALLVKGISSQYVVVVFGARELIDVFSEHMAQAFPESGSALVDEPIV